MLDLPPLSYTKIVMVLALALALLLVARSLISRDRSTTSRLSLEDMLLDERGQMSSLRVVMLGAFALTSWVMVYLTLTGKITETYFAAYGSFWIIPIVTRVIKGPAPVQESDTVEVTRTSTTTKP